jgi:hypothetical protein
MRLRSKKVLAAAGATLAVAAGAGGALAAGGHGARGRAVHPGPAAIASYLGLTPAQLREQLRSGKTLAQIAVARGKTVAGLEDAIYADIQSHLDRAVANGKLTAGREAALLARLKSRLDDIVDRSRPVLGARIARPRFVARAAAYLGITAAELRTELRAGKSLAQVATDHGKSAAGLKSAILAAVKARLDRAVSAYRLSADRESAILDRVSAHLDDVVARTGLPARG